MKDEIYNRLATVLDILPNGFPSTESGVEIKLLKKIFTPEEADLFCDLKLRFESAEDIAKRTGRPIEGLQDKLDIMWEKGEVFAVDFGDVKLYKMIPWVFGIFEFQLNRLDREFVELTEEYAPVFGRQFFNNGPQLMQSLPIEKEISIEQEALPYERVSSIIERSQSFLLMDCICKKEKGLLDHPCDKPVEVCMGFAPAPGLFKEHPRGCAITKDQALEILEKAESAGLVHLTNNFQDGHFYICNCCGCCCGVLSAINDLGLPATKVVNSHYYAVIDIDECTVCGICADERCQVNAIQEMDDSYKVIQERCIGCGLCISTCPSDAMKLVRKMDEEIVQPPSNEKNWFDQRGRMRGIDFSDYK